MKIFLITIMVLALLFAVMLALAVIGIREDPDGGSYEAMRGYTHITPEEHRANMRWLFWTGVGFLIIYPSVLLGGKIVERLRD
jgi:hypothetical protein